MGTLLIDYVRGIDSELFEVMDQLCMGYSLRANKSATGITFLHPVNPAVREQIFSLAKSSEHSDVLKAASMINAMIITENLSNHRSFHERKDNITNRLNQKILVSSVNAAKVVFANDAYAKIDNKFAKSCGGNTEKYSIYNLYGELPIDGDVIATTRARRTRRGRSAKSQHADQQQQLTSQMVAETLSLRHRIIATTAGEYFESLESRKSDNSDPYVKKSISLLLFVKQNYPDLYPRLLACTSLEKSDLYLYLQSNTDNFLIPHKVIEEWNNGDVDLSGITIANAIDTIASDINTHLYPNEDTRIKALENIDEIRDDLRDNLVNFDKIQKIYKSNINQIPEKVFAKDYTLEQKMWEDDFRMTCWALFNDVEANAMDDGVNLLHSLEDALAKINECNRGNYQSRMRVLGGGSHIAKDIPVFINSIYFIYIPVFDILKDLDLNAVDEIEPYLEEDCILAGSVDILNSIKQLMGNEVIGTSLSTQEILCALDILLAKKQKNNLSSEEEWKITQLCETAKP